MWGERDEDKIQIVLRLYSVRLLWIVEWIWGEVGKDRSSFGYESNYKCAVKGLV